jgi:hypothetical protein
MSRQPIRQRPPADDDLQSSVEEELRKPVQAAGGTTTQAMSPARAEAVSPLGPGATADRKAYFGGRYAGTAPVGPDGDRKGLDAIKARRLAEFGVPDSLHDCIVELIHILRDRGLVAALRALHDDPAIDRRYQVPIRSMLMAIDQDERPARP